MRQHVQEPAQAGPPAADPADGEPSDAEGALSDFARRWTAAELHGDVEALDDLLTDDFTAVGPRGFILDKAKWLDRYTSGALVHDAFTWEGVTVRQYGSAAAVAVGVQGQQSVYDGRDADGRFRITQTIVRQDGAWKLAAVHLSPTGAC
jgi:hypothetical protein